MAVESPPRKMLSYEPDRHQIQDKLLGTAMNLLGLGGAMLVYWNYLMIAPYISSFVWAAILAVLLRAPRDWLMRRPLMERLRAAENAPPLSLNRPGNDEIPLNVSSASLPAMSAPALNHVVFLAITRPLRKVSILIQSWVLPCLATRRRQLVAGSLILFWSFLILQALTSGAFWSFLLLALPLGIAITGAILLVLVPINTLVALLLVVGLVLVSCVTGGVFAAQVLQESAEFAYGSVYQVHDALGNDATLGQTRATLLHLMNAVKNPGAASVKTGPWADTDFDRIINIASLLYSSRDSMGRNDTKGFRQAVKGLQGIFKFEDALLESLVKLDYGRAVWHPLETVQLLISNSQVVLRACWRAAQNFGSQLVFMLMSFSFAFFNYTFSGLIFFASLFYMVQSEVALVDRFMEMLPLSSKSIYKRIIMNYIRGIFLASIWSFLLNAVCTGIVFFAFGIQQFLYTSMLLAGLCAMFPVVPVWLVFFMPAAKFFFSGLVLTPIVFLSCGFAISWFIAPLVYLFVPYSHPYVTGLSLMLGIYTYGLEGVILGPMIVCFTLILYSVFSTATNDDKLH